MHGMKKMKREIGIQLNSSMLELDPATEQFIGPGSKNANQYLNREYRSGYEVPALA